MRKSWHHATLSVEIDSSENARVTYPYIVYIFLTHCQREFHVAFEDRMGQSAAELVEVVESAVEVAVE